MSLHLHSWSKETQQMFELGFQPQYSSSEFYFNISKKFNLLWKNRYLYCLCRFDSYQIAWIWNLKLENKMSQNSLKRGSNSLKLHVNLRAVVIFASRTTQHRASRAYFVLWAISDNSLRHTSVSRCWSKAKALNYACHESMSLWVIRLVFSSFHLKMCYRMQHDLPCQVFTF